MRLLLYDTEGGIFWRRKMSLVNSKLASSN